MTSKFHYVFYLLKTIEKWVYYCWRSFFLGIDFGSTCCGIFCTSGCLKCMTGCLKSTMNFGYGRLQTSFIKSDAFSVKGACPPQQVEPKSIPRKKTPPTIINPFFNNLKQVKIIVEVWGHVSRAVFEILTFKMPNFEPKSKVKVRNLVVLAIFSTFMQIS